MKWAPPKYVRFLRTSSKIYEESLPILARSSRLELLLMEDPNDTEISTSFKVNFEHLLTSPATSLFLRATLPLVRAMDLGMSVPICEGRLEGLETLTSSQEDAQRPLVYRRESTVPVSVSWSVTTLVKLRSNSSKILPGKARF